MVNMTARGFEVAILYAFRYAVGRHQTKAITRDGDYENTLEATIINNLDKINANFKCQMMEDIVAEFEFYDNLEIEEKYGAKLYNNGHVSVPIYTPHYLDRLLEVLKEDYRNTHNGKEWKVGIQN